MNRARQLLRILGVNIDGATSKLEKPVCVNLFNGYDIVCLSEVKTTYPFGVPGFECIRSLVIEGEEQRGGVAVLFKSDIWSEVYDVIREKDQVWFKLYCAPGFLFCAIYVTPSDSPYCDPCVISLMQSNVKSSRANAVIIGDLNARIPNLSPLNDIGRNISYAANVDTKTNPNGKAILKTCIVCDLKPINHLQHHERSFTGNLTYKKGKMWVSQLDWCLVSANALDNVADFSILQSAGLPTNHAPVSVELRNFEPSTVELVSRSSMLGESDIPVAQPHRKHIPVAAIDSNAFTASLPPPPDTLFAVSDVDSLAAVVSDTLYETARQSKGAATPPTTNDVSTPENAHQRWSKLLKAGDSKAIWRSIDWNGKLTTSPDTKDSPSDHEFCKHYEQLMNPPIDPTEAEYIPDSPRYIPVLDDPISPNEVHECINDLNGTKAAGVDGLSPGVLKLISAQWLLLITFLLNCVFFGSYPIQWAVAKVFNIFKKGDRLDPGNYRGISIMSAIAKLYDMILSKRLQLWYSPCPQQAGAQKGRGCEEQIFVIRLLIDIARKCGFTLYIGVVDYQKAYDKVKRWVLLDRLYKKGCGTTFLLAISASLLSCMGLIGSQYFQTSTGVRQGASSSCPLFVFFLDATVEAINSFGADGWLDTLHTLLLMDDTVIFATSKSNLEAKLKLLKQSADKLGMVIHPTKSRFLCINASDKSPIILDDVAVTYTQVYTYLGSIISMERISDQVKRHFDSKYSQILKFYTFLYKNNDAPFYVKRTVWDSALKSSLFYSSETWLTKDLKCAESAYMATLKRLLDVRTSTNNEVLLVETGVPSAVAFIRHKQLQFLHKLQNREGFAESYVGKAMSLAIYHKSDAGLMVKALLNLGPSHDHRISSLDSVKECIRSSVKTRHKTYLELNPSLSVSPIYSSAALIPEFQRIAFTRMRLSSHRLRIETGRWSRIARHDRLCECGKDIQTEEHVLLNCELVRHLRDSAATGADSIARLLSCDTSNAFSISKLCFDVMKFFSEKPKPNESRLND